MAKRRKSSSTRRCRVQSGKNKGRFTKCGGGATKRRKRKAKR